ncbi:Bin/amphiphysin/Rvs domain for vesicular trafficking-domain-containing protein [Aspergillus coremiiformis]|uniref:Bin/amphiphysin/Rvs domain for vesicular trafficking-domain-containing protein n=1 Tax=Aspergillus coremiiformis TaxID=138285 RepID=A0A5N6Z4I3_9EURO|nr:Bin/amphiphysin/Rvs domain for vesicular trafficking-domain-containing protein [Aspergillus coremiiformis]
MSHYNEFRRSTGVLEAEPDRWDTDRFARERRERHLSRGPPIRRVEDERFEYRLQENDRYGPPARRAGRQYEDDHLIHPSGPLVVIDHPRGDSPSPRPRLVRRQSSLDTFDRIPSRKRDEYYHRAAAPSAAHSPPPARQRSIRRSHDPDYYEEIRIAEPDYFGDEEYRGFRDRSRASAHPRRSGSHFRERVVEEKVEFDKPYPRKGKTKVPRRLIHAHAIRELGYPYEEEGDMVIIQLALSKDQIDEVISRTRIIHTSPSPVREKSKSRTVERAAMEVYSPRTSYNTLIVEPSPSRHRSRTRHYDISERKVTRAVSRARSISVHGRRRGRSSPVRMVEPYVESSNSSAHAGPLIVVRPRDSREDFREYTPLGRRSGELSRKTEFLADGDYEEVIETKRDRKGDNFSSLNPSFFPSIALFCRIVLTCSMDKVQAFGKNLSASFSPFAARTQQMIKEQLGQAEDKTQLPDEYLELEKRVDALKLVHQKLLQVTSQYSNEAYDYPPNIRESFNDLGRTISEKVQLLSHASSPAEAQAALTAPPSAKPQPKTFNHAIARASLSGSQTLAQNSAGEDPLATALEKYALASEKVGEARLSQDAQIQSRFLAGWNTTLNTNLMFATKARRNVENARLMLDSVKASKKAAARGDLDNLSEEARAEIEQAEDEFVGQTEEAVSVMKNVLDTPEPLRNLADLIAAQLEFHKRAYEILSELAPVVDGLQVEQEV